MRRIIADIFCFAASLFVLAHPASTAPIPVRGGEHDGFTRLVLDLPGPRKWSLKTADDTRVLRLSNFNDGFDLTGTFQKLSTGRVTGLTPNRAADGFEISLGCDCTVEAFMHGQRMLVLDVHGSIPSSGQQAGKTPKTDGPGTKPQPAGLGSSFRFPFHSDRSVTYGALGFSYSVDKKPDNPPQKSTAAALPDRPTFPEPTRLPFGASLARSEQVAKIEQVISEQIGRAATQGLLSPNASRVTPPSQVGTNSTGTERPGASERREQSNPKGAPGINVRAQTGADRDFLAALAQMASHNDPSSCLSDHVLDIAAWADARAFGQQVGDIRARLVGEFDKTNSEAQLALARLYLHFGFGAEALQVLNLSPEASQSAPYLASMARIMESGFDNANGPFTSQIDCHSHAAFWSVLAQEHLPNGARPDQATILRAVNALPVHLRQYLGPMASDRLVEIGQPDTSRLILRLVERGTEAPDENLQMSDGKLHAAEGEMSQAAQAFGDVARSNTELSPEAVIRLIDSNLASEVPIDAAVVGLAGAYAQEYRDAKLGADLKRVHILSLASSGDFEAAFTELEKFLPSTDAKTAATLRSENFTALAIQAKDADFLSYSLPAPRLVLTTLTAKAGNLVAERLIDLGFPQHAGVILAEQASGPEKRMRRVLRSRAALEQQRPRRAEAELLGLQGGDVSLLRAQARAMAGDHATAKALFANLSNADAAENQAWLSSDWAALAGAQDPSIRPIAELLARRETTPAASSTGAATPGDGAQGPLARDRALLESSANTRAALGTLLEGMRISPDPDPPG